MFHLRTALKFGTRAPLSCTYLHERKVHVNRLLTIDFMLQSSKLNNQMDVQDSFFQIRLQWWLSGFNAVSSMCIKCVDTEIIVVINFIIIISTSDIVSHNQTTFHASSFIFIFLCRRHIKIKNKRGGMTSGLATWDYKWPTTKYSHFKSVTLQVNLYINLSHMCSY